MDLGFILLLADRLKKSVSEIMDLTTLEMDLWAGWIKIQNDATNEHSRRQRAQNKRGRS